MADVADETVRSGAGVAPARLARPATIGGVPALVAIAGAVLAVALVLNLVMLAAPGALGLQRVADAGSTRGHAAAGHRAAARAGS